MFPKFRRLVPVVALITLTTACHDGDVMNDFAEVRSHTWDTDGRLSAVDIERHGEPVVRFEYGYDEAGRRVSATRLAPGEPPKVVGRIERELDDAGRLLDQRILFREPANGVVAALQVAHTRDASGRVIGTDTTLVKAEQQILSPDTTPTEVEDPIPLDGTADPQFDPAPGEVAMMWYPTSARNSAPEAEEFPTLWAVFVEPEHVDVTWHAAEDAPPSRHDGLFAFLIVSRDDASRTQSWDFDGDGDVDAHEVTHLDEAGSVVSTEEWDDTFAPPHRTRETHFEGTTEVTTEDQLTTRIEYDADGHRVRKTEDHETDRHIDWEKTYEYDPAGLRIAERCDGDGDGVIDVVWVYAYDAEGRLVTESKIDG